MAGQAVLVACRHSLGGPGGSDRQGRGQRPQAGLPGLGPESRTQSLREPQLVPVEHCNWLRRGASRPGEAEYCERRNGEI